MTAIAETPDPNSLDQRLTRPTLWLAHYTSATAAFEHIVPTGRLRLSPYNKMRDPFENRNPAIRFKTKYPTPAAIFGDRSPSKPIYAYALAGVTNPNIVELHNYVALFRAITKLVSFTMADSDGTAEDWMFEAPWARPRMWEQYADSHAGVCLLFDLKKLLQVLPEQLGPGGEFKAGQVQYSRAGFAGSASAVVDKNDFDFEDKERLLAQVREFVNRNQADFFFLKTNDWKSEREFRVVQQRVPKKGDKAVELDIAAALECAVVGENFPNWQAAGAKAVCDEASVELRRVSWYLGKPSLEDIVAQTSPPAPTLPNGNPPGSETASVEQSNKGG